jgi:OOP family OmpA-OmpF porin
LPARGGIGILPPSVHGTFALQNQHASNTEEIPMNKKIVSALAALSTLSLAAPASAGFFDFTLLPYAVASVGLAQHENGCGGGPGCDDSDVGYRVGVGLEVNEYMGMEFAYVDLGKSTGSAGSYEVNGVAMHFPLTYKLNDQFTLMGRAGFGILHSDFKPDVGQVVEDTDFEWSLGVGMQYSFSKTFAARVEFERYFSVGDQDVVEEEDIDLFSVGLAYKF